jgi:hypothetical protein
MEKCAHRETTQWSINAGRCMFHISFAYHPVAIANWCDVGRVTVTIDMLPDVALLEIFDCYMDLFRENKDDEITAYKWSILVHVCQKWRSVIFGSPRRLDLQLFCSDTTPVKETLAVWPRLPIIIEQCNPQARMDNIIVALEHNDRVCRIDMVVPNSQWEEVFAQMQQPFPALTDLSIQSNEWWKDGPLENKIPSVVPELFLGGSAPGLQYLNLIRVPFPGLPKLLLSAAGLVSLRLWKIPHSGYISPKAMVRCLSTLPRLEDLLLEFKYPLYHPLRESRHPYPAPTRPALPALTCFQFEGASEYLDDLVARIDAPLLDSLHITFFHQLIFDTPQLAQFVARTPNIQPHVKASIDFSDWYVQVTSVPTRTHPAFELGITRRQPDWQRLSLTQVCGSSFREAFIATVEHLYIHDCSAYWPSDIEDSEWPAILRLFAAVKCFYLSWGLMSRIAPALQELAGEVLPSLQKLFLTDLRPSLPVQGTIKEFVAARQLAGHPIAVSPWDGTDLIEKNE